MTAFAPPVSGQASSSPWATVRLYLIALLIVWCAESIGNISFNLGPGKIVLMPLLWALLIGAGWGLLSGKLPAAVAVSPQMQARAAAILQPALLLFIAKLGLLVGGNIPKLMTAGWALALQEFGHFFGTILLGLPVALLLGIKREAIGATFSVGREPSLAIIGEKFGMNSPEGRGVLAEYITGTVFGAVFIALLAGFMASLNIFSPQALAMGAGVGSGSMMAAASGAIAAQHPELAKEVAAFAAAANLITTTVGTYFTLFLSLPAAIWMYEKLEPVIGRRSASAAADIAHEDTSAGHAMPVLSWGEKLLAWVMTGVFALIGNAINYKGNWVESLPGLGLMIGIVLVGVLITQLFRNKVPAVMWVSLVAMLATYPAFPMAADTAALTGKINFMAITTPMLAFAGLSIARDVPAFRKLGWRIVVTSLCANAGTFIFATLIAHFFGHL